MIYSFQINQTCWCIAILFPSNDATVWMFRLSFSFTVLLSHNMHIEWVLILVCICPGLLWVNLYCNALVCIEWLLWDQRHVGTHEIRLKWWNTSNLVFMIEKEHFQGSNDDDNYNNLSSIGFSGKTLRMKIFMKYNIDFGDSITYYKVKKSYLQKVIFQICK